MANYKFYYGFNAITIDYSSTSDIKKYYKPLNSFTDLSERFHQLKMAFDNKLKERAELSVVILPDISGLVELQVFHRIQYRFFSREVKHQCFIVCATKYEDNGETIALYEYKTTSFNEVKTIFSELVEDHIVPKFGKWLRYG
ncbi:MAG: hypothetical protein LBR37_00420 [Erysipelotrichaceae bacterium]|jgi:hypothetical protein|nr:hypothetical protein [Erysipelotrichaceae bacterium]